MSWRPQNNQEHATDVAEPISKTTAQTINVEHIIHMAKL